MKSPSSLILKQPRSSVSLAKYKALQFFFVLVAFVAVLGQDPVCPDHACQLGRGNSRREGVTISAPRGRSGRGCRTQCVPEQAARNRIARGEAACGTECPESPNGCAVDPECPSNRPIRVHRINGMGTCRAECAPPAALNGNAKCGPCP